MSNLGIAAIRHALPAVVEDNVDLVARHGFDRGFIEQKLGIATRHKAGAGETTASLAADAGRAVLAETATDPAAVDVLIVVTQTPDYLLPHVSALVHGELGLAPGVAAFDVSLGCSGFVYGLGLILPVMQANGWRTGLLITSETYSRLISPADRATAPLFGDGAAATLISAAPRYRVGKAVYGTDGASHQALIARGSGTAPGAREPLYMDGRAIFNFMMKEVPKSIDACLAANGLGRDDIGLWVFHQASGYMLKMLGRQLGIPADRLVIDLEDVGNTVSSTIPLALERAVLTREPAPSRVLVSGFGVGLSWASAVLTAAEVPS